MKSDAPRFASFPVSPENVPTKHRAIFSSSFAGLSSHHVQPASMPAMPQRHRHVDDDSLRLIDDLTNRPMDVLYSDSRRHPFLNTLLFIHISEKYNILGKNSQVMYIIPD